jgi:uncharacterized protein YfkK (UPF0435 family)
MSRAQMTDEREQEEAMTDDIEVMREALNVVVDHILFVLRRDNVKFDDLSDLQTAYDAARKALNFSERGK